MGYRERFWRSPDGNLTGGRLWYTQAKPWMRPLPMTQYEQFCSFGGSNAFIGAQLSQYDHLDVSATNEAISNFNKKLVGKSQSAIATTLAEHSKARQMAYKAVTDLRILVTAARRRDPNLVLDALRDVGGVRDLRTIASRRSGFPAATRELANRTLEFNFGWAPLVSDVSSAVRVLVDPFQNSSIDNEWVKGTGQRFDAVEQPMPPPWWYSGWQQDGRLDTKCLVGARVRVSNPNLLLLNQLGLLNPVGTLYELTPWSFLVGWVSNANSLISGLTSECGFYIEDRYYTISRASYGTSRYYDNQDWKNPAASGFGYGRFGGRRLGHPKLRFELSFQLPPVTRVINALALLAQQLTRSSR